MTTHEWLVAGLGFLMTVSAPLAWRKWNLDPTVSLIVFIFGVTLVVNGRC